MIGDMYEDSGLYKSLLPMQLPVFIIISEKYCLMVNGKNISIQQVDLRLTIFKECWVKIT